MAMLAEPRSRKRYHLNPKGKALYEDETRFGTKMLEKMGWSKGKGLGANEDGAKDFVRVRFKDDAAGLGFENNARDDQWTSHEDSFNGLLKSLNGEAESQANGKDGVDTDHSEASDSEMRTVGFGFKTEVTKPQKSGGSKLKEKISGISLEEKSATSRARVHYKKFTRGKDLSRYSEKDLANIFGKKVTVVQTEATGAQSNTFEESSDQRESKDDVGLKFAGVTTVSTGLSVGDYFKRKMESLKNKKKSTDIQKGHLGQEQSPLIDENTQPDAGEKQRTKKRKKHALEIEEIKEKDQEQEKDSIVPPKKKKKSKNKTQEVEEMALLEFAESSEIKQKKKKKKGNSAIQEHVAHELKVEAETTQKHRKSKHVVATKETALSEEDKKALPLTSSDMHFIAEQERDRTVKKTKKKKKNKNENDELNVSLLAANIVASESQADSNRMSAVVTEPGEEVPKKKKNKRSKDINNVVDTPNVSVLAHEPVDKSSSNESECSEGSTQSQVKLLSMDELLEKFNSSNVYTISQFCAEKFRNLELSAYKDSSLAKVTGYGISDSIKLQVVVQKWDEERLLNLWSNRTIKYTEAKAFRTHLRKVQMTKKMNVKRTQLSAIKRRHAFTCI